MRVIVPFAPGGATDVVARLVSDAASQMLGQNIVIENRAGGAAGLIGSEAAAKSAPDGYTIMIHSNAHVIAPSLVARMPFDPIADFAPVAHLGRIPQVLVINRAIPATDMQSLITWLRANSGKINFASAGIGSANHLTSEVFRAALPNVEMQMVQYRGGGPAMAAVISGEAHMAVDPTASATSHIRAGTVRGLVIATPERSPMAPDVPTAAEAGLPAFQATTWTPWSATLGTPLPIRQFLYEQIAIALRKPEVRDRLIQLGNTIPDGMTPDATRAFIASEIDKWVPIVRATGARVD